MGENIADNGGLHSALLAYRKYEAKNGPEPRLPGLEQYSPEQLFFIAFATVSNVSSIDQNKCSDNVKGLYDYFSNLVFVFSQN